MRGSCHCGAIAFEVAAPPAEVSQCNCSLCRRLGWLCAYYPPEQFTLLRGADALDSYVQGDRTLAVKRCKTCGCPTHWVGLPGIEAFPGGAVPKVGINARLLEDLDWDKIAVRKVDGASY
jgi:hypothetical protein